MLSLARTNTSLIGQWWWTVDRWMLAAVMVLIFLGVLLIMAASPAVADQHNWSSFHFIKKHIIFLIPTIGILIGVSLLSLQEIRWFACAVFCISMGALMLTPFIGIDIKGACRWLDVGGISVQPSEFVKPAFAVICAWVFSKQHTQPSFPGNLIAIGLFLFVIVFLLLQPDLGMTALITLMWFSQFFLAGLPLIWIFSGAGCGIGGLFAAYFFFPHVARRVNQFFNSEGGDKFGNYYQVNQSLEAFMNGGFIGQGPGEGTVKKYLPDAHADFIFAVAGEEFGMILCLLLVCIFAFIILRSFLRIFDENNMFVFLAVTGLIIQFGLQAIINMASTLNLIPTKGMTLPFISYGGSSMLALAIGMGMVLGLTRRRIGHYEKDVEKRIVLSAGGTGGHVFPAQALAHELISQGYKVFIFSDGRGHQFKDPSIQMIEIAASQLQGSFIKKLKGGLHLLQGIGTALYHLRRIKPHGVVGFGGYASFPTIMASAILRLPTIIHQADAYFGRTNRKLAAFVTRIATSFPSVENIPVAHQKKVSFTGLPVRSDIQPVPYVPSMEKDPFHILVTGGSRGAKIFGEVIPSAIQRLDPSLQKRLYITQQCRAESLEATQALYKQTQAHVELMPFLDQMGERYKRAHLVIERAGASSVVETALVGRPALFIPYPHAMDNHQFYNAQQAVNVEGGWIMKEKDFTSDNLAALLLELITSHWKLMQAAANIREIAIPDASQRLANLVTLMTALER